MNQLHNAGTGVFFVYLNPAWNGKNMEFLIVEDFNFFLSLTGYGSLVAGTVFTAVFFVSNLKALVSLDRVSFFHSNS